VHYSYTTTEHDTPSARTRTQSAAQMELAHLGQNIPSMLVLTLEKRPPSRRAVLHCINPITVLVVSFFFRTCKLKLPSTWCIRLGMIDDRCNHVSTKLKLNGINQLIKMRSSRCLPTLEMVAKLLFLGMRNITRSFACRTTASLAMKLGCIK